MKYIGVKTNNKLSWKSHVDTITTKLNQANVMVYRVRDFANANILKSIFMHYVNPTLTMFVSYGDKTSAQSIVSTFSRERQ